MHLIAWLTDLLDNVLPVRSRYVNSIARMTRDSPMFQLDERFRAVPEFAGLKTFKHFSQVKQWTGNKQKAIVRQLVVVIAPLLRTREPAAVLFTRAVMDFVLMAQYKTHSDATLAYIEHALYRMDKTKDVF